MFILEPELPQWIYYYEEYLMDIDCIKWKEYGTNHLFQNQMNDKMKFIWIFEYVTFNFHVISFFKIGFIQFNFQI